MSGFDLQGAVVLLTGATGGIGEATAEILARHGATLVLSSNEPGPLDALTTRPRDSGTAAQAFGADLAVPDEVRSLGRTAQEAMGRIDVVICNGGVEGPVGPIGEAGDADLDRLFAINLRSAITLTSETAPAMAERGRGSIVLVSSIAGRRSNKAIGAYGVAKASLTQLARNLAVEWGPRGVRANSVSPGLIQTPFAARFIEEADRMQRWLSLTPLRRVGRADEIASAILFLASESSSFVTGHDLVVDGGALISDGN